MSGPGALRVGPRRSLSGPGALYVGPRYCIMCSLQTCTALQVCFVVSWYFRMKTSDNSFETLLGCKAQLSVSDPGALCVVPRRSVSGPDAASCSAYKCIQNCRYVSWRLNFRIEMLNISIENFLVAKLSGLCRPRRSLSRAPDLSVRPRRSLCFRPRRLPALFVSGPGALCRAPALFVSASLSNPAVSVLGAAALCRALALSVSDPGVGLCVEPGSLCVVSCRSLCRAPALSASGPGALPAPSVSRPGALYVGPRCITLRPIRPACGPSRVPPIRPPNSEARATHPVRGPPAYHPSARRVPFLSRREPQNDDESNLRKPVTVETFEMWRRYQNS